MGSSGAMAAAYLDIETRCRLWENSGQLLRAAVAWQLFIKHGAALSAASGVPLDALDGFVKTGRIRGVYRAQLKAVK